MKVGLVLSGGMAKGAYQLGALKAIREFLRPEDFACISASSIGVLNGYAFATEKLKTAEELWKNLCQDSESMLISRVLKGKRLQSSIKTVYSPSDAIIPSFFVSLLNINRMSLVYYDIQQSESLPLLLQASVAMPVYNRAVVVDGESYFDGAMVDNIPTRPLLERLNEIDYIICIYFDSTIYTFENPEFDKKVIKLSFPTEKLVMDSVTFKKSAMALMIEEGYEKSLRLLRAYFCNGISDIDYILSCSELLHNQTKNPKLRISGDFLVSNLNRVAGKLMKKRII